MHIHRKTIYNVSLITIVLIGILLRCFLFLQNNSFIWDEAALAINIQNNSLAQLFHGLEYCQVAPPIFLIISKILYKIISPTNIELKDYMYRIIPLISGTLAIPAFYYLVDNITKNKTIKLISTFLFVFNTTAILFCTMFKQYSLELLVSVILITVFYKIIFHKKYKNYYSLIIAIAPWFSLSSILIIGSYFLYFLLLKKFSLLKIYYPFLISSVLFYIFYLKSTLDTNFNFMYSFWNMYGVVDLSHPLRLFIRTGGLLCYDKIASILCSIPLILLSILSIIKLNKNKFQKDLRIFLALPILTTFTVSLAKLYPIEARLILFLLPLIVIILSFYNWKAKRICLLFTCLLFFSTAIYYSINPYATANSTREITKIIANNIKSNETIITDFSYLQYYYYLNNKNNMMQLKNQCYPFNQECNLELKNLNKGRYYLLLTEYPQNTFSQNIKILKQHKGKPSFIYFEK